MKKAISIVLLGVLSVMISANVIAFYRMIGTVPDLSKMPMMAFFVRAAGDQLAQVSPSIRIDFDNLNNSLVIAPPAVTYRFADMSDTVLSNIDVLNIDKTGHVTIRGWSVTKDPNDYIQYVGVVNRDKLIGGGTPNADRKDVEEALSRTIIHAGFSFDFQSDPYLNPCQAGIFVLMGHGGVSWLKRTDGGC